MTRNKSNPFRAAWKLAAFLTLTCFLVLVQFLWVSLTPRSHHQSPIVRFWFKTVTKLLRIKVKIKNKNLLKKQTTIFLSNHISYLDIIILGSVLDCFFVSKNDVADWPFFGFLSKIGGTVFISRKRADVKNQIPLLAKHLKHGQSLLFFPEGTTGNGQHVLPFKSSLLNVITHVDDKPLIQPISLAYTKINKNRLQTQEDFDHVAWYADMTLAPHLWAFFGQKKAKVVVTIHETLESTQPVKDIITQAHALVTHGFEKSFR